MKLGIGSYTYGWSSGTYGSDVTQKADFHYLTAFDLIDKAMLLDVPVVQICVKPDLDSMTLDELASIRRYAEDNERVLEIGTVGSEPIQLLRFLEIAAILGAGLVRTIFTQASPELREERQLIRQVADHYAKQQVYLAIENHEASSFLDLQTLCQEIDNAYIGVCLDTVNSLGRGEGVREVTTALMPHTVCLHVKDFTVIRHQSDMELTITGAAEGAGQLDIPAQFELLHNFRKDASVILEQWTPLQRTMDETVTLQETWAQSGIAYLKTALAQWS